MRLVRFVLFFVLATAVAADAATQNAASCNRNDVISAVNSASDGDVVGIPAGTCTWTSTLTIDNKAITLQGAGIGQTIIADGVPKGEPSTALLLVWNVKAGGLTRMTEIMFEGSATNDNFNSGMIKFQGNSHNLRIDHVRVHLRNTSGLSFYGFVWGVIDHCVFNIDGWVTGIVAQNGSSWNNVGDFGDASWADASYLGTERALFFEDNVFTSPGVAAAIDGWMGGRVVFRHNALTNTFYANHGTETSGRWRSQRTFEVYDNTFAFNNSSANWSSLVGIRGGTGVVYNNTGTTSNGGSTNIVADLTYLRWLDLSRSYDPWGFCRGSGAFDGNSDSNGYPCLDQPGRGKGDLLSNYVPTPVGSTHQALEPIYGWNNILNGQDSPLYSQVSVVAEGRDFNNTVKPGYTAYSYPHPLVTGNTTTGTGSGPLAPQNLRIVKGQ
jgi:hypothetical protein